MAITNLQTLVKCAANLNGVRVTGTESKDSMRANGSLQAPFLSLPSLPLAGPFPIGMNPDNQGVLRAGRSACMLGVVSSARTSASYHRERKATSETAMQPSWLRAISARG